MKYKPWRFISIAATRTPKGRRVWSRLIDSVVEESDAEDREILTAIATANHPIFFED